MTDYNSYAFRNRDGDNLKRSERVLKNTKDKLKETKKKIKKAVDEGKYRKVDRLDRRVYKLESKIVEEEYWQKNSKKESKLVNKQKAKEAKAATPKKRRY
jgi:hypothetical protein